MTKRAYSDSMNPERGGIRERLTLWTQKYIVYSERKTTISVSGTKFIEENSLEVANLLYLAKNALDYLNRTNEDLNEKLNELKEDKRTFWETIFGKDGKVETYNKKIEALRLELAEAKTEINSLKREISDLVWVREQIALMKRSEEARDKYATYNMKDSRPKDFNIAPEFSKVGRQIYGICNKLFRHCHGQENNRAQGIARIYSELSRVIVWDLWNSGIKANYPGDAESPEATAAMADVILNNLQINKESIELISVRNQIDDLVKKGRQMVADIVSTEAPGELFLETIDIPFDKEKHEAMPSCPEDGQVESTVYPGYRVADVVLSKPIVFTSISSIEKNIEKNVQARSTGYGLTMP